MSFSIGDTIDAYRILEELGRGGMGQVFKVEHTLTRRLEAMKVLEGGRPESPGQATRSLREIQVQAGLDHPNIAAVHNAFWVGDDLILVMELIEGASLRRLLETERLPLATAIDYARQALSALSYAHAHGVVHRDVSPSNMMVSSKGVLKLTDFGLSKGPTDVQLSQPGVPIGPLYYMSPEQVRGAVEVGVRSDIYSLGAVLYELVTGARPFEGDSAFSLMMAHVEQPPVPPIEVEPNVPPLLNEIILRSLAKDPLERFPTADAFRETLAEVKPDRIQLKPRRVALPRVALPHVALPHIPAVPRSWLVGTAATFAVLTVGVAGFVRSHDGRRNEQPSAAAAANAPAVQAQKTPLAVSPPPKPVPLPMSAAHAENSRPRILADKAPANRVVAKRAVSKPETIAAAARETALDPATTISNTMLPRVEERPTVQVVEPPPPLPAQPQEHAAIPLPDTPSQPLESPYTEAPKAGSNGLKKGIGKLWHMMRLKKSAADDDAPAGK